jgi:hypothetical protein
VKRGSLRCKATKKVATLLNNDVRGRRSTCIGSSILLQERDVGIARSCSQAPGLVPASPSEEHPHLAARNKEPVKPWAGRVAVPDAQTCLTWHEASLAIPTVKAPIERWGPTYVGFVVACAVVWAVIWVLLAILASTLTIHRLAYVFLGWVIGFTTATIAIPVYRRFGSSRPSRRSRNPIPRGPIDAGPTHTAFDLTKRLMHT